MDIIDRVILVLNDLCGAEDGELEPTLDLFEAGLLDSFAIIQLMVTLEEQFGVQLNIEQIPRERITTPEKITDLVRDASA